MPRRLWALLLAAMVVLPLMRGLMQIVVGGGDNTVGYSGGDAQRIGLLRDELRHVAATASDTARHGGSVANQELRSLLQEATVFVDTVRAVFPAATPAPANAAPPRQAAAAPPEPPPPAPNPAQPQSREYEIPAEDYPELKHEDANDPHSMPEEYHLRVPRPPGWASKGCGIGPPPRRPAIPQDCMDIVKKYFEYCSNASRVGDKPADRTWYFPECTKEGYKGLTGHPVTVMALAKGPGEEINCGPPPGQYDVLDSRVDGPRSVEVVSQSSPHPWMQLLSFRPFDAGEYSLFMRPYLRGWGGGWSFARGARGRNRATGKLAQMGQDNCPLIRCNSLRARWACMVTGRVSVAVTEGNCPPRYRPPCREVWPAYPGAWFGRWVKNCTDFNDCAAHPVMTRPLDGSRSRISHLKLLLSTGGCGATEPVHPEARRAKSKVFHDPGGWVWEPDVCTPRYFSVADTWKCMNNSGYVSVGNSVAILNGHMWNVWLDMKPVNTTYVVSERGKRHDEPYGKVRRHPRLHGGGEQAESFFWQLARLRVPHFSDFRKAIDNLYETQGDLATRSRAFVLSLGMHESVHGLSSLEESKPWLRHAFSGLKHALIWAPNPSPNVRLYCSKKNSERLRIGVSQISTMLHDLVRERKSRMPPTAFLPSYESGKAMSWDIPMTDSQGTHPYCSMVGLTMWQQTLDLTCPV